MCLHDTLTAALVTLPMSLVLIVVSPSAAKLSPVAGRGSQLLLTRRRCDRLHRHGCHMAPSGAGMFVVLLAYGIVEVASGSR